MKLKPVFTSEVPLNEMQRTLILSLHERLESYQLYLENNFHLNELPKAVFWTSDFVMQEVLGKTVPAFTRDEAIYMSFNKKSWYQYFMSMVTDEMTELPRKFYNQHTEDEMLCILGHELAHHSDLFLAEFDDDNPACEDMWFEEGMVMYLPRKYFYDDETYNQVLEVEKELYHYYKRYYQHGPLEEFTYDIYGKSRVGDMFHYWRSFIAIDDLVKQYGSEQKVFEKYHQWDRGGRKLLLSKYFEFESVVR